MAIYDIRETVLGTSMRNPGGRTLLVEVIRTDGPDTRRGTYAEVRAHAAEDGLGGSHEDAKVAWQSCAAVGVGAAIAFGNAIARAASFANNSNINHRCECEARRG